MLLSSIFWTLHAGAQEGSLRLIVGPTRLLFTSGQVESRVLSTFLSGGAAATADIALFDAVIDDSGGWSQVELGSTAASLKDYVQIRPSSFEYTPDGTEQTFNSLIRLKNVPRGEAHYGVLVVTLRGADRPEGNEAAIAAAAAVQVIASPTGDSIEPTSLSLAIDRFDVRQSQAWTPIDVLLPDIPNVIGRGPAIFSVEGQNTGESVLEEQTVFEVRRVSPLALINSGGALPPPLVRVSLAPKLLLPKETFRSEGDSLIPIDGQPTVDSLPFIGFVQVTARAVGSLGGVKAEEAVVTKTILVVPWSEGIFLLGSWVIISGRRRRAHSMPRPPARILQRVGDVPRGRRLTQRLTRRLRRGSGSDPDQPTLF